MSYGWCYDSTGNTCSGKAQPGAVALRDTIMASRDFGAVRTMGIYNCRPSSGGGGLSTHGEGRGWDAGFLVSRPVEKAHGDAFAAWLVGHAQDLGIQRVIWNGREWDAREKVWEAYTGPSPHTDHVHVELCWAAARTLTAATIQSFLPGGADLTPDESRWLKEVRDLLVGNDPATLDGFVERTDRKIDALRDVLKGISDGTIQVTCKGGGGGGGGLTEAQVVAAAKRALKEGSG